MIRKRSIVCFLGMITLATPTLADQCAWVTESQAVAAKKLVELAAQQDLGTTGAQIAFRCQLCDTEMAEKSVVNNVEIKDSESDKYPKELWINNEAVDIAYVYIKTGPSAWFNLSKLSGCESDGVSTRLRVDASGNLWPVVH